MPQPHTVSIRVNDRVLDRWQSYEIENDMMSPADSFSLALSPGVRAAYDLVPPDSEVEIQVDDTVILSGFTDDRQLDISKDGGSILTVSGRDRVSRMLDESADLTVFPALQIREFADRLAKPTFPNGATLSNAANRDIVRGRRSGKAAAKSEPVFAKRSQAPKKVEPGETRWDVMQHVLEPANLLAWAQADGKALVVGLPNYDQDTQYKFFSAAPGSSRSAESNIKSFSVTESTANRYSQVTVTGASRGNSRNYGKRVTQHQATVLDGNDGQGTGKDFRTRKQLIIADDNVKNARDAADRAQREFDIRQAERLVVEIDVLGHSQRRQRNDIPALFAFDTMADLELEEYGIRGRFMLVAISFRRDKQSGETARIKLIPEGTLLTS